MRYNDRKELCLLYNFAQHYRTNIFQLMDKELHCDFVFGDSYLDVKKMDYSLLSNVREIKNKHVCGNWYYQCGALSLLGRYKKLFVVGDVHCLSTWAILLLAKAFRTKVYLWGHGWYGKESGLAACFKKIYFKLTHGVFLYGTYAHNLMISKGFSPEKLHVIYNSLDYDHQITIRQSLRSSDIFQCHFRNNYPNVIFVGRLTPVKRLDMLLDCLAVLRQKDVTINLTFIGDGEKREALEKRTHELHLDDSVWFYGACYDEHVLSSLIYNADVCVSPGNVGLTAMHSMVFGTPVITHNNFPYQMPEFEAIQKGETGDFFEYDDVTSLADTLDMWLTKQSCRREAVRESCYRIIDTFYNPHYQIRILKQQFK